MDQFAILHEFEDTQFLVNKSYEPETDEFNLTYKFWSAKINGYIEVTMSHESKNESNHLEMFEKLKDKGYCELFMKGTVAKFF